MVCTFIGHRTVLESVRPKLRAVLLEMIEQNGANCFYVGHQGEFDAMVYRELKQLRRSYSHIVCRVVLAYYPTKKVEDYVEMEDTLFPLGIERVPYRFAISWRNNWMMDRADFLIAYVKGELGHSHIFLERAMKKGIKVVNLAE